MRITTPRRFIIGNKIERVSGFGESVLLSHCETNNGSDTDKHDNALEEVVECSCLVASESNICCGEKCHEKNYYNVTVFTEVEYHSEKS